MLAGKTLRLFNRSHLLSLPSFACMYIHTVLFKPQSRRNLYCTRPELLDSAFQAVEEKQVHIGATKYIPKLVTSSFRLIQTGSPFTSEVFFN